MVMKVLGFSGLKCNEGEGGLANLPSFTSPKETLQQREIWERMNFISEYFTQLITNLNTRGSCEVFIDQKGEGSLLLKLP